MEGRRMLLAGDFMTFLYPDDEYDEDNIEKGLFRGPLLLAVRRNIL